MRSYRLSPQAEQTLEDIIGWTIDQFGIDNMANLTQSGYGNTINLQQQGNNNFAEVIQEGNTNVANVLQEGEQTFTVHQIGNDMVVNITQF